MKSTLESWSKEASVYCRGVAILIIVLHNYFHWLPPKIGENEFSFHPLIPKYWEVFTAQPEKIIQLAFSVWGWIAVAVFVFFSAYGLTLKFWSEDKIAHGKFLGQRIMKLYPTFIMAILVHFFFIALFREVSYVDWLIGYLAKLSLLTNFIPGYELKIVGPWWFFSLIFQIYLFLPILIQLVKRYGDIIHVISIGVFYFLLTVIDPLVSIQIKMTFLGWLPEISMGIYCARRKTILYSGWLVLIALFIFILGNFLNYIWPFQTLAGLYLLLQCSFFMWKRLKQGPYLTGFIMLLGRISLPVFAINGPMRHWVLNFDVALGNAYYSLLFASLHVAVVVIFSYVLFLIDKYIQQWLTMRLRS